MRDHYLALGIPRNASERMVKLAFEGKMKALADAGVKVGLNPTEAGDLMAEIVASL